MATPTPEGGPVRCLKCNAAGAGIAVEAWGAGRWRKAKVCRDCAAVPGSAGIEDGGGSLIIRNAKKGRRGGRRGPR